MKTKTKRTTRTTEITVERDEVQVIRRVGRQRVMWCSECGRETQMMTRDEAMAFGGVGSRTISAWVEIGRVHSIETGEGRLLICISSLLQMH